MYLEFSIKNAGFVFAVEICDLSVYAYNFYSIIVELSFVQRNSKCSQKIAKLKKRHSVLVPNAAIFILEGNLIGADFNNVLGNHF